MLLDEKLPSKSITCALILLMATGVFSNKVTVILPYPTTSIHNDEQFVGCGHQLTEETTFQMKLVVAY